jgi:hypothetical protein
MRRLTKIPIMLIVLFNLHWMRDASDIGRWGIMLFTLGIVWSGLKSGMSGSGKSTIDITNVVDV